MRKYLHKFESLADFNTAYNGSDYHEPWVSLTKSDIPSKIKILLPEEKELILNYIEKAPVDNDGSTIEMYIWQVENSTSDWIDVGDYMATNTIEEKEYVDTYIEKVEKDSGNQEWDSTEGYSILELIIIENPRDKVDYNKGPFTGDLIVDASDHGDFSKVTWINPNLGTIDLIPESSINKKYVYSFTGNKINLNEPQEELKVRVLNFRDMPYVDVTISGDGVWPIGTPYVADWVGNITSDGMARVFLRYVNGGSDMGISADFTPYFRVTVYDDAAE